MKKYNIISVLLCLTFFVSFYLPRGRSDVPYVAATVSVIDVANRKVLKELQRAGLVASTRGAHGGYALARPAAAISAADIIDAVEGPVGLTECATHPGQCDLESSCRVGRSWQRVNVAIHRALGDVTLTQLTARDAAAMPVPDLTISLGARPGVRMRA